jgi:hypothetical protein
VCCLSSRRRLYAVLFVGCPHKRSMMSAVQAVSRAARIGPREERGVRPPPSPPPSSPLPRLTRLALRACPRLRLALSSIWNSRPAGADSAKCLRGGGGRKIWEIAYLPGGSAFGAGTFRGGREGGTTLYPRLNSCSC